MRMSCECDEKSDRRLLHGVVQFLPGPPDVAGDTSDGSGDYRPHLDNQRNAEYNHFAMNTLCRLVWCSVPEAIDGQLRLRQDYDQ